jgi:pimeloyl-ACP methyl ester carboxylesterase
VYIGVGLGAGPRDSLQLAVTLRAGVRPGVARAIVEGGALLAGWLLGGAAGLGTVVSVVLIGGRWTCPFSSSEYLPTLLLYGDEDVRAPTDVAHDLHAAIPTSRLVVMPGVGHMSSVEAPERFSSEVRAFLSGQPV